jgi:hypothetical protein
MRDELRHDLCRRAEGGLVEHCQIFPHRMVRGELSEISCAAERLNIDQAMALVKRSPKRTANWALAMHHSRGGMIHSFSERFKTRKRSFVAASSLGK